MSRVLTATLAVTLVSCTTPPAPVSKPTAADIYMELEEAGCLAPTDGGSAAVTKEANLDGSPAWFTCLLDGGAVAHCGVPCGR